MAYSRFGTNSQTYLWGGLLGIECTACRLTRTPAQVTAGDFYENVPLGDDMRAVYDHLKAHLAVGLTVDLGARRRLRRALETQITDAHPSVPVKNTKAARRRNGG